MELYYTTGKPKKLSDYEPGSWDWLMPADETQPSEPLRTALSIMKGAISRYQENQRLQAEKEKLAEKLDKAEKKIKTLESERLQSTLLITDLWKKILERTEKLQLEEIEREKLEEENEKLRESLSKKRKIIVIEDDEDEIDLPAKSSRKLF